MRHILRFVPRITDALMRMQETQRMELIDLNDAPNDEITYLVSGRKLSFLRVLTINERTQR